MTAKPAPSFVFTRMVRQVGSLLLPVMAVKLFDRELMDRPRIEIANVDAITVRVRAKCFSRAISLPSCVQPATFINNATNPRLALRRFFHLFCVGTRARRAVHLGAVIKNLLRRRDVARLALPRFERRILQRAGVGKTHLPRMGAELVHFVQVFGGALSLC